MFILMLLWFILHVSDILFVSQVKSFIETQRALLSEIQNGCKRNFILAKEKEETEQKMRLSASMAEIATEDGTTEEVVQPASEEGGHAERKEGEEGETTGNEGQTGSQSETGAEASVPQMNLESDSDTEDEEEEEVVTKSSSTSNSSVCLNQTAPQTQTGVAQPLFSASHTSSSPAASPAGGPSVISGITVTESSVPPGTPPSPGRCISVSSPGRGHKIFMVTRVESPPEQQQLQLQLSTPAAPSQTKEASEKPADANTPTAQQTQPSPSSQTPTQTKQAQEDVEESSPAPSTDCKLTQQSPVAHLDIAPNTTQTHTLEPQSASQPTEDVTASTLGPEETDPSQQAPALPSDSSSAWLTEDVAESTKSPQAQPTSVEGEEEEEGRTEDKRQMMSPDSTEVECRQLDELGQTQTSIPAVETQQQPVTSALEQLQNELASASEETQSQNQTKEEEEEALAEAPATLSENEKPSLTGNEYSQPSQEEPCPKQQTEADEQGVQPVLSAQTDQQAPSVNESNPPAGGASKSLEPALTAPVSPVEVEDSPDESSADEGECFAEAPQEELVGSALPNGLKPEFSLHLLDTESPKPGSCVMEHGESL